MSEVVTAHQQVLDALVDAQNRLSMLLMAEHRDMQAVIEAADEVRRAERLAAELDRR